MYQYKMELMRLNLAPNDNCRLDYGIWFKSNSRELLHFVKKHYCVSAIFAVPSRVYEIGLGIDKYVTVQYAFQEIKDGIDDLIKRRRQKRLLQPTDLYPKLKAMNFDNNALMELFVTLQGFSYQPKKYVHIEDLLAALGEVLNETSPNYESTGIYDPDKT